MRRLVLKILLNTISFYLAAAIIPTIKLDNLSTALLAGIVLALINSFIRPLLMILALPINLVTMGLFIILINTWMVMLADKIINGIYIPGFWPALATALIISTINYLIYELSFRGKLTDR